MTRCTLVRKFAWILEILSDSNRKAVRDVFH